ncbi:hypothetical protein LXL04_004286 [Taraxacum kok-saghyz]
MSLRMWGFRPGKQILDYKAIYDGMGTLNIIKLYHGGEFTEFPDVRYINGNVSYVDMIPNVDMHFGLRTLENDQDIQILVVYVMKNKLIRVYLEHGESTLLTYFMAPDVSREVIFEEINEQYEEENELSSVLEVNIPPLAPSHVPEVENPPLAPSPILEVEIPPLPAFPNVVIQNSDLGLTGS